jgi:hypothetical protein
LGVIVGFFVATFLGFLVEFSEASGGKPPESLSEAARNQVADDDVVAILVTKPGVKLVHLTDGHETAKTPAAGAAYEKRDHEERGTGDQVIHRRFSFF